MIETRTGRFRHSSTADGTRRDAGFTLIELMIAVFILMTVSGIVLRGVLDMNQLSETMSNRAEMHSALRNATALLQQEVGQAGRVALPGPVTLTAAVVPGNATVGVSDPTGMFVGQFLVIDGGDNEETVQITALDGDDITAVFELPHNAGVAVAAHGGFAAGVIPTTVANGSGPNVLKIVGDINGDGRMVYVEYTCDIVNATPENPGRLFRSMMPYDAADKPDLTIEDVLIGSLLPNPPNPDGIAPPCFTYQERTFGGNTYVIGVAIMTTVQTRDRDPVTNEFQTVTKALLNVAPRNVYNVWQLASLGYNDRVQPLPPTVEGLFPVEVSFPEVKY